ncbi:MAG: hypothetical protein DMF79_10395, partial [Acidobacteria bacterium]
ADCASTLACLRALGVEVEREGGEVRVRGHGLEAWRAPAGPLDAGNSGSTPRMLAGAPAGRGAGGGSPAPDGRPSGEHGRQPPAHHRRRRAPPSRL